MPCQLIETLFQAIRLIHQEEGTARDYGTGIPLYHAEVNLLDAVYRYPEKSASDLAAILCITKGALTQTARKLMDKGLIEQYNPPRNRKVKYHRLTPMGETARQGHARFHAEANGRMQAYLCARPQEEKRALLSFFQEMQQCMPICMYDCERIGCACNESKDSPAESFGG